MPWSNVEYEIFCKNKARCDMPYMTERTGILIAFVLVIYFWLYLLESWFVWWGWLYLFPSLKQPTFNQALLEMFRVDYIGNSPYISCIPSVLHHRLSSSDRFLVLSSDGLYQYFSNEEVVSHVTWFMENAPEGDPAQYLIAELLLRAAKMNG